MSAVAEFLAEKSARTEQALDTYFNAQVDVPETLLASMRYSLFAGGKRLRPALALGACEIACGEYLPAIPAACALEMIHTYSLIHDDLPAMDDDDLRRGQPTNHKKYGEAMAILAGDGLLTMAFDVAAQTDNAQVVREIAQAAGIVGMVGGQVLDMESEGKHADLSTLQRIHRAKTGALIRGAVRAGALCGGVDEQQLSSLTVYGEAIGLAFQIADDILDVVGDEAAIGKPVGSDAGRDKSTYPALLGLDESRALARQAVDDALAALAPFGEAADPFRELATFIIEREH